MKIIEYIALVIICLLVVLYFAIAIFGDEIGDWLTKSRPFTKREGRKIKKMFTRERPYVTCSNGDKAYVGDIIVIVCSGANYEGPITLISEDAESFRTHGFEIAVGGDHQHCITFLQEYISKETIFVMKKVETPKGVISLKLMDYCQGCSDFDAKVEKIWKDGEIQSTTIMCKNATRCERIKRYLSSK